MIAAPPLLDGAFQLRLIWEVDAAVAERLVGADGAVGDEEDPVSSSAAKLPKYDGSVSYGFGRLSFVA